MGVLSSKSAPLNERLLDCVRTRICPGLVNRSCGTNEVISGIGVDSEIDASGTQPAMGTMKTAIDRPDTALFIDPPGNLTVISQHIFSGLLSSPTR
jgi:hypothetical protein